jgi:uncharacterized protein (DUF433 family)
METRWQDHIVSTPNVLRGKPCLKSTRIPVSLVLGYLASGATPEEVMEEFPDLARQDVTACLRYARDLSDVEVSA